jgi:hypothetical protein
VPRRPSTVYLGGRASFAREPGKLPGGNPVLVAEGPVGFTVIVKTKPVGFLEYTLSFEKALVEFNQ